MTDATTLAADLDAVAAHLPLIATELEARTLTSVREHAFGALLIELGETLHQHADTHTHQNPWRALIEPPSAHDRGQS